MYPCYHFSMSSEINPGQGGAINNIVAATNLEIDKIEAINYKVAATISRIDKIVEAQFPSAGQTQVDKPTQSDISDQNPSPQIPNT